MSTMVYGPPFGSLVGRPSYPGNLGLADSELRGGSTLAQGREANGVSRFLEYASVAFGMFGRENLLKVTRAHTSCVWAQMVKVGSFLQRPHEFLPRLPGRMLKSAFPVSLVVDDARPYPARGVMSPVFNDEAVVGLSGVVALDEVDVISLALPSIRSGVSGSRDSSAAAADADSRRVSHSLSPSDQMTSLYGDLT